MLWSKLPGREWMQLRKDLLTIKLCFWDRGCRDDSKLLCIWYPRKPRTASLCEGSDACVRRSAEQLVQTSSVPSTPDTGISIISVADCALFAKYPGSPSLWEFRSSCGTWKASDSGQKGQVLLLGRRQKARGSRWLSFPLLVWSKFWSRAYMNGASVKLWQLFSMSKEIHFCRPKTLTFFEIICRTAEPDASHRQAVTVWMKETNVQRHSQ